MLVIEVIEKYTDLDNRRNDILKAINYIRGGGVPEDLNKHLSNIAKDPRESVKMLLERYESLTHELVELAQSECVLRPKHM